MDLTCGEVKTALILNGLLTHIMLKRSLEFMNLWPFSFFLILFIYLFFFAYTVEAYYIGFEK